MKKNFSQSFDHQRVTVHFLIEVKRDAFVHFDSADEPELDYYNGLSLEIGESMNYTDQLAKRLYENGFSLNHYRELARETEVVFSFVDDTPGYTSDEVCLHICADQINDSKYKNKTTLLALEGMIDRFEQAPDLSRVVALSLAQLFNERDTLNIY